MFGWKRVGIISENDRVYKKQSNELFSELRLMNITVFYYNILSFDNKKYNDCDVNNVENIMNSIKDEVRILIVFVYGLMLEEMARIFKDERMEKGYVFIAADNYALGVQNAKNYPNWMTFTVFAPKFNEVSNTAGTDCAIFKGMICSSPVPVEEGFLSPAGDYKKRDT